MSGIVQQASALFSLQTSRLLVCWSSSLTSCEPTPLDFHAEGKLPSCLTMSMFTNPLLPLPGRLALTRFYFLFKGQKKETQEGTVASMGAGKWFWYSCRESFHKSFCCYWSVWNIEENFHENALYRSHHTSVSAWLFVLCVYKDYAT